MVTPAALLADIGVAGALLHWSSETRFSAPDLVAAVVALAALRHDAVGRWRRPSVTVCAAILTGALLWLAGHILQGAGFDSVWITQPWAAWVLPWPGHLGAAILARARPRRPIRIPGRGAWSARARLALARTPCGWRPARADETDAPTADLPHGSLAQLDRVLETPSGAVPLAPEGPHEGMGQAVKRVMDLSLVLIALPVALPMLLILALMVRIRDGAPVFYAQTRVTQGSRRFRIHKLRSMVRDAEAGGRPVWPEEGDPRITPLGRFLRRFWLDELPQLWDVLRGPLSLVGPRPERPFFVQDFSARLPNYPLRHQVKAGITGLAQVTGFVGNTSIDRRLHADLRYLRRWTPILDLAILLATVFKALKRPPIRPEGG